MSTNFPILDANSAPAESKPILEGAQKAMGFVPNLFGLFATSPAVFEAYTTLAGILDQKTDFSETERQTLFLTISALNDCTYCVAAHSTISKAKKVDDAVVQAIRDRAPIADPKLQALRTFAEAVVSTRGFVEAPALDAFRAAGYGDRHVLEVVLAVAFKTISNYSTHIASPELDSAFQPQAWNAPAAV